jgi:hypothetical protein
MAIECTLNGEPSSLDVDPQMPLLWEIRDLAGLRGTKYGCGKALCGACTVHLDGQPVRSCVLPVSAAAGRSNTTVAAGATAAHDSSRILLRPGTLEESRARHCREFLAACRPREQDPEGLSARYAAPIRTS